jgi:hypothetical protein
MPRRLKPGFARWPVFMDGSGLAHRVRRNARGMRRRRLGARTGRTRTLHDRRAIAENRAEKIGKDALRLGGTGEENSAEQDDQAAGRWRSRHAPL